MTLHLGILREAIRSCHTQAPRFFLKGLPMEYRKVVRDPVTGMSKTQTDDVQYQADKLKGLHKDVRDMLDGNTQFHVDPYADLPRKAKKNSQ